MLRAAGKIFGFKPAVSSLKRLSSSSSCWDANYKTEIISDVRMAYVDIGVEGGDCLTSSFVPDNPKKTKKTAVFLHGNPTSSYVWRNVIPHVAEVARCIAPDLIGMGKSQKVPQSWYNFEDHYDYLSQLLQRIDLPEKINLVLHDWGSGFGFHWANNNRERIESITFMESIVAPLTWNEFPDVFIKIFEKFRSPLGDEMILENNFFVEQILPMGTIRQLTNEEMTVYREPFCDKGEARRVMLTFPREIPFEGDGPEDNMNVVKAYSDWLAKSSDIPKLFIDADPGMLSLQMRRIVKNWPNLKSVTVKGRHYIQEDSPDEIGKAIQKFLIETS